METNLRSIHDLLPQHKIGDDFRRKRKGRLEPLPLYVRNEIHHPTKGPLLETEAFQQDKRIGYAIMEAWLSRTAQQIDLTFDARRVLRRQRPDVTIRISGGKAASRPRPIAGGAEG